MKIFGPPAATLTGLAVGDSLGMPFEMSPGHSPLLLGWQGGFENGKNNPFSSHLKAGQWTDDTQMAKALAGSLLREKTYSPADAARSYLAWYQSDDVRGIGGTTEKAMVRLASGFPWTQSGIAGAEGNGSAMRIAPLGLLFHCNIQAAAEMAAIDSRITHKSPDAEAGAMAVALGVAALLQGAQKEAVLSKVLEWLPDGLQLKYRLIGAEARIRHHLPERELADSISEMGVSGHVLDTVPAAFVAFMSTTNFRDAVRAAILAGGDTDTTGAITGALAGTYYGITQVAPFLENVELGSELRDLEMNLYVAARQVGP